MKSLSLTTLAGGLMLLAASGRLSAGTINVPNNSFESPVTAFVNINIDSWQKTPKPDWFVEDPNNVWTQLTGTFRNPATNTTGHIDNCDGNQAVWLFARPEVGVFQDYDSVDWNDSEPTHAFDATFRPGKAYRLKVGLIVGTGAGGLMQEGVTLELSLYYRDALSNRVVVATTGVTNSSAVFSNGNHFLDFEVNTAFVQPTDAWAGQHIGILFISTVSSNMEGGYWDLDNVRLTEIGPPVLSAPVWTNNQFQFLVQSEPGLSFEVISTTNLSLPRSNWSSLGTVSNGTGTVPFVDTAPNFDQRFYQIRQLP